MAKSVIAIVAHPDDIEFLFAGTMLQLAAAGYQLHYMALASGNCGSLDLDADETRRVRRSDAEQAAEILGAGFYLERGNADLCVSFYCYIKLNFGSFLYLD